MRFLLLAALAGLCCLHVNSETANDLKFKLPGVSGRYYDEGIFSQKKRKIFFIISPHCRYSSKFYDFITKIFKELNSLLYATYLVSPNYPEALIPDDLSYTDLDVDLEGMSRLAKRHNFTIPFIYDGDSQKITHHFEVNTTPAVVYLGKDNELIYKGKIGEITPTGGIDTSYIEKILRGDEERSGIITKLRGTEIKTKEDLKKTSFVLRRYANETIKVTDADEDRISFYLKFHNKKITIFYVWQREDSGTKENLLKITDIYKIYRKRGLSLVTICISKDHSNVLRSLTQAQSSGHNFMSNFYDTNPIFNMTRLEAKLTPTIIAVGKRGEIYFKSQNTFSEGKLKAKIVEILEK